MAGAKRNNYVAPDALEEANRPRTRRRRILQVSHASMNMRLSALRRAKALQAWLGPWHGLGTSGYRRQKLAGDAASVPRDGLKPRGFVK